MNIYDIAKMERRWRGFNRFYDNSVFEQNYWYYTDNQTYKQVYELFRLNNKNFIRRYLQIIADNLFWPHLHTSAISVDNKKFAILTQTVIYYNRLTTFSRTIFIVLHEPFYCLMKNRWKMVPSIKSITVFIKIALHMFLAAMVVDSA